MSATGDIFNYGGTLFLTSLHFITAANRFFNLSAISIWRVAKDLFVLAEIWGTYSRVAAMCINVQLGVQHTGQCFYAYLAMSWPVG